MSQSSPQEPAVADRHEAKSTQLSPNKLDLSSHDQQPSIGRQRAEPQPAAPSANALQAQARGRGRPKALSDQSHALSALVSVASTFNSGTSSEDDGQQSADSSKEDKKKSKTAKECVIPVINSLPWQFEVGPNQRSVLIVAMRKKVLAKPMQEILKRMSKSRSLMFAVLDQDVFVNEPIEAWPVCDCLVAFHSGGYPLSKVEAYAELRSPFLINDLKMEKDLLDRRHVYRVLRDNGIPVPRSVELDREKGDVNLIEEEDAVVINGERMEKPFVVKPFDAEDHNILIYFPSHDGGGAQHLYRKKKDQSSSFLPECDRLPEQGSYIIEEFMPTGGTDIKVYTVGPNYAHAEGRKAPVVDGKVLRDADGKELRCPILLNAFEKDLARRVVEAFGQNICGFDLLRTQDNKSYVCDVNGWSFVKRSPHYYDDCAQIMHDMIVASLFEDCGIEPEACAASEGANLDNGGHDSGLPRPHRLSETLDEPLLVNNDGNVSELRCVIGIVFHSERTPKQKLKAKTSHPAFLELFDKHKEGRAEEVRLKSRHDLQDVLQRAQRVVDDGGGSRSLCSKLEQLVHVLTKSPISGINRKFQLKPSKVVETDHGSKVEEATLVMKWGGQLTDQGLVLARQAGARFRNAMYPSSGEAAGLLRLHSTYRHDLKMYSSDEGRVQMTAASFAKGLLQLDGEITPILVSLVRKDRTANRLLDTTEHARREMEQVKQRVQDELEHSSSLRSAFDKLCPSSTKGGTATSTLKLDSCPMDIVKELHSLLNKLTERLKRCLDDQDRADEQSDSLQHVYSAWTKVFSDLKTPDQDHYDFSKLPDVYDSLVYWSHIPAVAALPETAKAIQLGHALASIIVRAEYGVDLDDRHAIGAKICSQLVRKVSHDLSVAAGKKDKYGNFAHELSHRLDRRHSSVIKVKTPSRHVRTRLYFTSEAHVHGLLNLIRYHVQEVIASSQNRTGLEDKVEEYLARASELNYLTHVVCRLFEDQSRSVDDPWRFYVEWLLCPGPATSTRVALHTPHASEQAEQDVQTDISLPEPLVLFRRLSLEESDMLLGLASQEEQLA